MERGLKKIKIISKMLKGSCTSEELRWYLKHIIEKAKKEVFDDIKKECPSTIWSMLNKEVIIPLKELNYR